jgi:hypothetical protein
MWRAVAPCPAPGLGRNPRHGPTRKQGETCYHGRVWPEKRTFNDGER